MNMQQTNHQLIEAVNAVNQLLPPEYQQGEFSWKLKLSVVLDQLMRELDYFEENSCMQEKSVHDGINVLYSI